MKKFYLKIFLVIGILHTSFQSSASALTTHTAINLGLGISNAFSSVAIIVSFCSVRDSLDFYRNDIAQIADQNCAQSNQTSIQVCKEFANLEQAYPSSLSLLIPSMALVVNIAGVLIDTYILNSLVTRRISNPPIPSIQFLGAMYNCMAILAPQSRYNTLKDISIAKIMPSLNDTVVYNELDQDIHVAAQSAYSGVLTGMFSAIVTTPYLASLVILAFQHLMQKKQAPAPTATTTLPPPV